VGSEPRSHQQERPCSPLSTSNGAASAPVGRWALKACRQIKVALGAVTMVLDANDLESEAFPKFILGCIWLVMVS
jgi:hypothetical protein